MASSSPTRFLTNTTGSVNDRDLALKVFSGSVYEAFINRTVFWDNTGRILAQKTLTNGHQAQWPIIGDDSLVTPAYHSPGTELLGQEIKMTEGTVTVDDILVSHLDIPLADRYLSHFDVMAPFANRLGTALAKDMDKKLCSVAIQAARTAATANVHNGGKKKLRHDGVVGPSTDDGTEASVAAAYPNSSTGSGQFRDDVAELAQLFDEDNVPENDRFLFISPYIRTIMRHEGTGWSNVGSVDGPAGNPYSKDQNSSPWDVNRRIMGVLEGFNLIVTNHIPTTNVSYTDKGGVAIAKYTTKCDGLDDADLGSAATGYSEAQAQANAKPAAIALCGASEASAAIGLVQAAGIRSTMVDDERRNTTFLKSQMMVGADKLCPWCAGYIGVYT